MKDFNLYIIQLKFCVLNQYFYKSIRIFLKFWIKFLKLVQMLASQSFFSCNKAKQVLAVVLLIERD